MKSLVKFNFKFIKPNQKVMGKVNKNIFILALITALAVCASVFIPQPVLLTTQGWNTFIIFLATIACLILNPFPMGVITFLAIVSCIMTDSISSNKALEGFGQSIVWLVVCAFFIARTVINTGLGTRIAYFFISRFGQTPIGVAYSIIFTELCISPMIPSATSRGGGIIYPIAKSVIEGYATTIHHGQKKIGEFFTMICLHSNIITSTMFLTAMAGNPIAQKLAGSLGVEITWSNWAQAAVIPGLISLILLPLTVGLFCKLPTGLDNKLIVQNAKDGLKNLGRMTKNELITTGTFIGLITLWIFEKQIGVSATTTAMLGVCLLLLAGVLTWNDIINEKSAWDIFIWFSILVTIANSLSEQQVTVWMGNIVSASLDGYTPVFTAIIVCVGLFFGHYMFASVTVYFTAMYSVFLKTFLDLGLPPLASAYSLVIAIMLSSGFTHYGISSAPVYFSGGYMTVKQWWKKSFGITVSVAMIWVIICIAWWSIIGWI